MEKIIAHYPVIAYVVTSALLIVKVGIYLKIKNANTRNINILYYPLENIRFTENNKRQKLKQYQNAITLLLILVLAVSIWMTNINN